MDSVILVLGCFLGVISAGGYLGWCWTHRSPAIRYRVIVNLTASPDMAFRGVWWAQRGPWLVLKSSELLQTGEEPRPLDGDVVIHRGQVSFVQRLVRE